MTDAAGAGPLAAAAWVAGAVASFAAMTVAGRELAAEFDTFEVMAYRSAVGLPIVMAAVLLTGGLRQLRTAEPGLHLGRNVIHFGAQNIWFWAVGVIPLAHLTALEFTNPIWVAMLAPFLLGERLTPAKIVAAVMGFGGVLVITRPRRSASR
jgi:drug/metabolite transporter (DMT)-like permease